MLGSDPVVFRPGPSVMGCAPDPVHLRRVWVRSRRGAAAVTTRAGSAGLHHWPTTVTRRRRWSSRERCFLPHWGICCGGGGGEVPDGDDVHDRRSISSLVQFLSRRCRTPCPWTIPASSSSSSAMAAPEMYKRAFVFLFRDVQCRQRQISCGGTRPMSSYGVIWLASMRVAAVVPPGGIARNHAILSSSSSKSSQPQKVAQAAAAARDHHLLKISNKSQVQVGWRHGKEMEAAYTGARRQEYGAAPCSAHLHLVGNFFSGEIPHEYGRCGRLEYLLLFINC